MHCFDADMVTGRQIIVKDKNEGKKFITLDGEEHTLGEHDLAICNAEEPMCIAGVFGGKGSGTYENTRNVVLGKVPTSTLLGFARVRVATVFLPIRASVSSVESTPTELFMPSSRQPFSAKSLQAAR